VLVVSVVQKRREIGILRAMGATRGQMVRVFLVQGGIVGAVDSVLGLALALQVAMVASVCGATHWVSCSSFTTFCRHSPHWRTSPCRDRCARRRRG
jgi:ABC-type antimicrobial peptide transport system permease subunit